MSGAAARTSVVAAAKRLVVKVGSSLVTNDGRGLDQAAIARWAAQIAMLRSANKQVILVSSGAIAEGMQRLGWTKRPRAVHELQAAAAVGQMGLVQCYEACFREHGIATAQVLLTHSDMADRQRYLNARSTLPLVCRWRGAISRCSMPRPTQRLSNCRCAQSLARSLCTSWPQPRAHRFAPAARSGWTRRGVAGSEPASAWC